MFNRQVYSPDEVDNMRAALDVWCALHNVRKDDKEAAKAARRILDLMGMKRCSSHELLAKLGDFKPDYQSRAS